MIKNLNILCIIPARAGSKGVPKKNIKILGDIPLIGYSINSAKKSKYINKVIVSTDSREIANISKNFGIEVPFLRPKELSEDKSLDIEYIIHTLNWLEENENYIPNLIILLRPTTPIREAKIIDDAIALILNYKNCSSLRSSHKSSESPFKWFKIKNNLYHPIHTDISIEYTNKPRQSFEDVYIPNGYVDILKPKIIKQYNDIYGDKILSFETQISYEIDTIEEFEYLEYKLHKDKNES